MRSHPAKAGASADDNGVIFGKLFDLRHRRWLIEFIMRCFSDGFRHQLRHPFDVDGGAGLARAFGDRVRHFFDVTVGGIIENENFRHGGCPFLSLD